MFGICCYLLFHRYLLENKLESVNNLSKPRNEQLAQMNVELKVNNEEMIKVLQENSRLQIQLRQAKAKTVLINNGFPIIQIYYY